MDDLMPREMEQPHTPPHVHSTGTPAEPSPKKRSWIMIAGIAIAAFIAFAFIIVSCVWSMGAPVMKAGELFLTTIAAGEVDKAYESAAAEFKETIPKEAFTAYLDESPIAKQVKSASFSQFEINNDIAVISGMVTGLDGTTAPVHMTLKNDNGTWRVQYLDFLTEEQILANQQAMMQAQQAAMQQQGGQQPPPGAPQGEPVTGEPLPGGEPGANEPSPGVVAPNGAGPADSTEPAPGA